MKFVCSNIVKSINIFIKKIMNLIPYIIFIFVYFFFVNIEASKEKNYNKINEGKTDKEKLDSKNSNQRITIPVIPFND